MEHEDIPFFSPLGVVFTNSGSSSLASFSFFAFLDSPAGAAAAALAAFAAFSARRASFSFFFASFFSAHDKVDTDPHKRPITVADVPALFVSGTAPSAGVGVAAGESAGVACDGESDMADSVECR